MTVVVLVVVAVVVVVVIVVLAGWAGRGFVVVVGGYQLCRSRAPRGELVVQDRSEPVFCTVLLAVLSQLIEW